MNQPDMSLPDLRGEWQRFYEEKLKELCPTGNPTPFARAAAIEYADRKIETAGVTELKFNKDEVKQAQHENTERKTVRVQSQLP